MSHKVDSELEQKTKQTLIKELKQLIITECDKEDEVGIDDISDDETLVGDETFLGLDSLDTLQLSLAIKKVYNIRIEGGIDGRTAFASVSAMADFILNKNSIDNNSTKIT